MTLPLQNAIIINTATGDRCQIDPCDCQGLLLNDQLHLSNKLDGRFPIIFYCFFIADWTLPIVKKQTAFPSC